MYIQKCDVYIVNTTGFCTKPIKSGNKTNGSKYLHTSSFFYWIRLDVYFSNSVFSVSTT